VLNFGLGCAERGSCVRVNPCARLGSTTYDLTVVALAYHPRSAVLPAAWTAAPAPRDQLSYGTPRPDAVNPWAVSASTIAVVSTIVGQCGSATIDIYDPVTSKWLTITDSSDPELNWTPSRVAGIDNGRYLVIGGPCSGGDQRQAVIVDPVDGTAEPTAEAFVALRGGYRYNLPGPASSWCGSTATAGSSPTNPPRTRGPPANQFPPDPTLTSRAASAMSRSCGSIRLRSRRPSPFSSTTASAADRVRAAWAYRPT
jgi:hypothetical protein